MNKKNIMTFSALQILIFHLWIIVLSGNQAELFLQKTAYIGVDVFFFLSAYSLQRRKITDIKAYYISRFKSVYLKYAVFTLIAAITSGWTFTRVIKILTGVELFQKGGGAFLWFIPAIMLFYILIPWIQKITAPNLKLGAAIIICMWFIIGILLTSFTSFKNIFIFWNRIPVLVCGALSAAYLNNISRKNKILSGLLLAVAGIILLWSFCFRLKLSVPVYDIFYVMAIPAVFSIVFLIGSIPENKFANFIGCATLEIYAVQMIWGVKLLNNMYVLTHNALLSNLITIIIVIIIGKLFNVAFRFINKFLKF